VEGRHGDMGFGYGMLLLSHPMSCSDVFGLCINMWLGCRLGVVHVEFFVLLSSFAILLLHFGRKFCRWREFSCVLVQDCCD